MKKLRVAAAALLLFSTAQAWAFRGRPVSDLRFEGRPEMTTGFVASDGTDFLVLGSAWWPTSLDGDVVVQKMVDSAPAGPQRRIGTGSVEALVWTGALYLAAWQDSLALWTAPLSRDGSLLAEPQQVMGCLYCSIAAGASSAMAFARNASGIVVQPLNLAGQPAGNKSSYPGSFAHNSVPGPAAGGRMALVLPGHTASSVLLFNSDGTLAGPELPLDGPGLTSNATATDGTDTLIAYTHDRQLKTAILGSNGTLKSRSVVHATSEQIRAIVRDGSQYAVLLEDATLVRITSAGERVGDPAVLFPGDPQPRAIALASNGRTFLALAPWQTAVFIDAATMLAGTPMRRGPGLSAQEHLKLQTGPGGYLAAWIESDDFQADDLTVRASRVDAAGNYLDGPGLVLGTLLQDSWLDPQFLRIDGSGPSWIVIWRNGLRIQAATVSHDGVAGEPMDLGEGNAAALLRDGPHYLVLRAHGRSLYLDRIMPDGTAVESRLAAAMGPPAQGDYNEYTWPALIRLGGRPVALFAEARSYCVLFSFECFMTGQLLALRVDEPSATPVVVQAGRVDRDVSVATDGERAVVMAPRYGGKTFGTILTAGNLAGTPFLFDTAAIPAVAFDGRDFVVFAWRANSFVTARVTPSGTVTDFNVLPEQHRPLGVALAASPALPPLAGFIHQHPENDAVFRAAVLFHGELTNHPTPPPAPSILCSARNADGTISVRWQPVANADGVSIELLLPDGTYRQIGVGAGGATGARVSTAGLQGSTVRVRAWNEGGLSAPSAAAPSVAQPEVNVRTSLKTCAGVPVALGFTLSGIAPFTVRWSDGVVQTNLGNSATRTVTLTRDTTLTIVSVADAGCAINDTRRSIRVVVDPAAKIAAQPSEVRVARGQSTTLTITANDATSYEWFEGAAGDTSRPVDGNGGWFTTPALFASTRYWVRVANRCGAASSQAIAVTVTGKSRAVR